MSVGVSEFGGGPGLVQKPQVGHETEQQELWEIYATDPGALDELATVEGIQRNLDRIAAPRVTYTPGGAG